MCLYGYELYHARVKNKIYVMLWSLNMAYTPIFLLKNTFELDIVLTRTVNILTTNELVKGMMPSTN